MASSQLLTVVDDDVVVVVAAETAPGDTEDVVATAATREDLATVAGVWDVAVDGADAFVDILEAAERVMGPTADPSLIPAAEVVAAAGLVEPMRFALSADDVVATLLFMGVMVVFIDIRAGVEVVTAVDDVVVGTVVALFD